MYSQVRQAAQLWANNNRRDGYLWSAERLKPVYEMIERRKPDLDLLVKEFIKPEHIRLLAELEDINTSHLRRLEIGDKLNLIGDLRNGLGLIKSGTGVELPEIDWCYVEVPSSLLGQIIPFIDQHKKQYGKFVIQPFYIGRYLITYAQFQAFFEAKGGYENDRWWAGLPYKSHISGIASRMPKNYPKTRVTWSLAVAFCRWLNAEYHAHGLMPRLPKSSMYQAGPQPDTSPSSFVRKLTSRNIETKNYIRGLQIRLPFEWEWQWAAQNGLEKRHYPWGEWDEYPRANTMGSEINYRTTAVGMYPDGAAECGALDMGGNLWEWCLNEFRSLKLNLSSDKHRARRGGSFNNSQEAALCAYRGDHLDPLDLPECGFRIVAAISCSEL
jgi:formylglycine-generating enzyme required for sulfatase activity